MDLGWIPTRRDHLVPTIIDCSKKERIKMISDRARTTILITPNDDV